MPPAVPRLADLCKRVLQANVASLVDVGDVPYDMLRDILPGCRVEQLREIEELSPQIAEEDEEIWEIYFKRDFPLVAEAQRSGSTYDNASSSTSFVNTIPSYASEDSAASLFVSYRDLYYDEQIAREERLASAGSRLKERIASIHQMKHERRVVVDPRLGFDKGRRRKRAGITKQPHWSMKNYKPKSLAEKAKIQAGAIAFAYHPPVFTRKSSMRIAINDSLPDKAKPIYIIPGDLDDGNDNVRKAEEEIKCNGTKFIERTINVRAKSSVDNPYRLKDHNGQVKIQVKEAKPDQGPKKQEEERTVPKKVIPGITRHPKPVKQDLDCPREFIDPNATNTAISSSVRPPVIEELKTLTTQLPLQVVHDLPAHLPLPPSSKRRPPSLFIPRKRPKVS